MWSLVSFYLPCSVLLWTADPNDVEGDNCPTPIVVTLPADLPYSDTNTTCGRGNDYSDTCLGLYDQGQEVVYQLVVSAAVDVQIVMDPYGMGWTGLALDESCPPGQTGCLATYVSEGAEPRVLGCRRLSPGFYTLLVDCLPTGYGDCIAYFTLSITACDQPMGACCLQEECVGTVMESECSGAGGTWYEGFDCARFACPVQISSLPESCYSAYQIEQLPFSAQFSNFFATADGQPGSCNAPGPTAMRNDVWFAYTPSQDGVLTIEAVYHYYDGLTVVYAGAACDQLNELSCLNSGGWAEADRDAVSLNVSAGSTCWVQLGDFGASPGGGNTLLALSWGPAPLTGDMNCDGNLSFADINPFVLAMVNQSLWKASYPGCPILNGDINGDGTFGFQDVNPFVTLFQH